MTLGNGAVVFFDFSAKPLPEDNWRAVLSFTNVTEALPELSHPVRESSRLRTQRLDENDITRLMAAVCCACGTCCCLGEQGRSQELTPPSC